MKNILVVDDNKTNLLQAKQTLVDEFNVSTVISGAQALKFLEKKEVDLILLDLAMPEMDGKQTLLEIKKNPATAEIPIIFLTANSDPQTEVECLQLGAIDFISKPFVPQVMCSRILRTLELVEYRRQAESKAKRFENIASTDALTSLWNRAYLNAKIPEVLAGGNKAAYLMIDVDRFKSVNDTLGHIMGDTVLISLSNLIREVFPDDIVARIGGDEFVVFVVNPPENDILADKIEYLQRIVNADFEKSTNGIASISVGVALAPRDGGDLKSLYDSADKALYRVKLAGKNGYCFFEPSFKEEQMDRRRTKRDATIKSLKENLMASEESSSALYCSYENFASIFTFVEREIARNKTNACLMLVKLTAKDELNSSGEAFDKYMEELSYMIGDTLRHGDVYTKYSGSQYAVLLPNIDGQNGVQVVSDRILLKYRNVLGNSLYDISLEYEIM